MDQGLIDAYRDKGFVKLEGLFNVETQALLRAHGEWVLEQLASGAITRSAQLTSTYDESRLAFLKTCPELLEAAKAILGPNVKYFQARTLLKDPNFKGMVPAHQDWPYFGGSPEKLNLFVPLTRCGLDQGPLVFYERSHLFGPLSKGDLDPARYPALTPVTVGMDVGDALAANFLAWHSSVPAESEAPRLMIQLILTDGADPAAAEVLAGQSTNPFYCPNFTEPMALPHPSSHSHLGRIWMNAGDLANAEKLARGMLAVEPGNIDAAILLADIDKARGGTGEAQLNWALERMEALKAQIEARLPAREAADEAPAAPPSAPARRGLMGRLKALTGA